MSDLVELAKCFLIGAVALLVTCAVMAACAWALFHYPRVSFSALIVGVLIRFSVEIGAQVRFYWKTVP